MTFDGRPQFSALVVGRAAALRVEGQRPTPAPPLWPSTFDSLRFNIFDTLPTATAPLRTVTGSETGGVLRWDLDAITTNLDLGGVARRRFKWAAYGIADSTTHLLAIGDLDIFESGDPTPAIPPDPPVSGGGDGTGLVIVNSYAALATAPVGARYYAKPYVYEKSPWGITRQALTDQFTPPS